jgi:hypothetical protein
MKRAKFILALSVILVLLVGCGTQENAKNPPSFSAPVKDVAIFKNGYGFFTREGEAELNRGWCVTNSVPSASLGTFWVYSANENVAVDQVITGQPQDVFVESPENLAQLLERNVGKNVTLKTTKDDKYSGTLLYASVSTDRYSSMSIAVLRSGSSTMAVPINQISSVTLSSDTYRIGQQDGKQLRILVTGQESGKCNIGMMYLQKGVRWIPSYMLDVRDDGKLGIYLKATVINDIEDLSNVDMYFVVGVPNFIMRNILSPMALETIISGLSAYFSERVRGDQQSRYYQQAFMTQVALSRVAAASGPVSPIAQDFAERETAGAEDIEDLFLYEKKNISMEKDQRLAVSLFEGKASYSDLYKWDVVDPLLKHRREYYEIWRNYARGYQLNEDQRRRLQELKRENNVWHYLRIKNETEVPWTTAPAVISKENRMLAQELMKYTPVDGEVDVRVTMATDIVVEAEETELTREHNALRAYDVSFDLVTAEGVLKVKNHKKKEAQIEVTKSFEGKTLSTDPRGITSKRTSDLSTINPYSTIKWTFSLKPGEEKELSYKYNTYVRYW